MKCCRRRALQIPHLSSKLVAEDSIAIAQQVARQLVEGECLPLTSRSHRLHQILQSHGPEVLRRAMEEGLKQQIFGAFFIERSPQAELSFPQVVQ